MGFAPAAGVAQDEREMELGDAVPRAPREKLPASVFDLRPAPVIGFEQEQRQPSIGIVGIQLDCPRRRRLCQGSQAWCVGILPSRQQDPVAPRQRAPGLGIIRVDLDRFAEIGDGLFVLVGKALAAGRNSALVIGLRQRRRLPAA